MSSLSLCSKPELSPAVTTGSPVGQKHLPVTPPKASALKLQICPVRHCALVVQVTVP